MAVRIRFKRTGTTNNPRWRIVASDSRSPRDGRFIEELGYYNPTADPAEFSLNQDRYDYWVSVGAQPTVQVKSLVKKNSRV